LLNAEVPCDNDRMSKYILIAVQDYQMVIMDHSNLFMALHHKGN